VTSPANVYTHGHHESVLRSHRWRTAENSAAYLLGWLAPGQSVLDIGAGPGTITCDLAELVAPGRVTATEINEAALELTRAQVAARGLDNAGPDNAGPDNAGLGGVDCVVADVHALHFADDSFDVVHAHQVLQHVADPVTALREMRRVTKPGGVVAARDGDYGAFTWYPRLPELDEWLALYQRAARANGGEPDAGRHLLAWARAAGFEDVMPSASVWCYPAGEDAAWWGGMWADRILTSDLARQLLAAGWATEADLNRISEAWRGWSRSADAWIAILHGEILARA